MIIFSTGQYTNAQIFSVITSVLSLSWNAARSFLIMRTADQADADPVIATVLIFVWPLTLVSGLETELFNLTVGSQMGKWVGIFSFIPASFSLGVLVLF